MTEEKRELIEAILQMTDEQFEWFIREAEKELKTNLN